MTYADYEIRHEEIRKSNIPTASINPAAPIATPLAVGTNNAQPDQYKSTSFSNKEAVAVISEEMKLQQRYVKALVKANPGLGPKSQLFAEDLIRTGLKPTEAMMLIRAVYAPQDAEGKGQGTRLKYFSEALIRCYGEYHLANARENERVFKGFLSEVASAVDMRDEINEALHEEKTSITFVNTLLLQEVGLTPESFLDYVGELTGRYRIGKVAAVIRIIDAAEGVREGIAGNLESLLFQYQEDDRNLGED